jgi:hypothetical protein
VPTFVSCQRAEPKMKLKSTTARAADPIKAKRASPSRQPPANHPVRWSVLRLLLRSSSPSSAASSRPFKTRVFSVYPLSPSPLLHLSNNKISFPICSIPRRNQVTSP